jgi:hypothetical protein
VQCAQRLYSCELRLYNPHFREYVRTGIMPPVVTTLSGRSNTVPRTSPRITLERREMAKSPQAPTLKRKREQDAASGKGGKQDAKQRCTVTTRVTRSQVAAKRRLN